MGEGAGVLTTAGRRANPPPAWARSPRPVATATRPASESPVCTEGRDGRRDGRSRWRRRRRWTRWAPPTGPGDRRVRSAVATRAIATAARHPDAHRRTVAAARRPAARVWTTSVRNASATPAVAPPRAARNAAASDAASANRRPGSLANADRPARAARPAGARAKGRRSAAASSTCIIKVSTGVAPRNGTRPVNASNTTMPSEYRSLRKSARRPRACSGLMYSGLPST